MKSSRLTLIAGLSLLIPVVAGLLSTLFSGQGETSIFYPLPGLVFWPSLLLLGPAAVAVSMVLFFVWNPGLFVAWIIVLWAMFGRNWKAESSFKVNLLVQWLLFAWLAWYAFPFFGEFI
jgi:hypothetical protein